MKIQTITSQSRNDFHADYECEHCGHITFGYGYHDTYFHTVVIPGWACEKCGLRRNGTPGDITTGSNASVRPDEPAPTTEEES